MAYLVLKQFEQNPENPHSICVFAYFEGEPSKEDLESAGVDFDRVASGENNAPECDQNEVSRRAGLQRWNLWYTDL